MMVESTLICRCDDEASLEPIARFDRVWKRFPDTTELQMIDSVLTHLMTEGGELHIYGDQWLGVELNWHGKRHYFECDRATDGILAIYEEVFMNDLR